MIASRITKAILVDAVHVFVRKDGSIDGQLHALLKQYPHRKILLTGADDVQMERFGLLKMPYEVFTLKHHPEKSDPAYYRKMLDHFALTSHDVVYFEHDAQAVVSARSVGIRTFHYDQDAKDLLALKEFLDMHFECESA
ncbi:hypothetical protein AUJ46_04895 [Candidatus Peregrinibacteria bacterium CG1_02_54_53]|nr:MAG: hypothetical protein AUJ46_04895 [Candidatus Peregrinibacteria bacterium CG1_02_54_53]